MPSWNELLAQVQGAGTTQDLIRRSCTASLHSITKRNVILYYSAWLQKPTLHGQSGVRLDLNDADKEAFMATIHKMDRSRGLDLFLHTPGGEIAATESIVDYLRAMFGTNIRAIIPQLAMSAGTMIACACKEIVMGKQSSLGPIDPQMNGLAAHGVIEEFKRAQREIAKSPSTIPTWQPIIAKYHPTMIGECEKAIKWSQEIVREWLQSGMFKGRTDAKRLANRVVKELGDHALTKSHARHISLTRAKSIGLEVVELEADQALQDAVLSVHHACMITLSQTEVCKLVENHMGVAQMQIMQMMKR